MATEILMPALSPTMEEGTLVKWLVKEGDAVKSGDVIAEIETDKATMEVEAVDEGRMGRILVPAGTENVKVNAPIAVLLEEGEDASAVKAKAPPSPQPSPRRGEGAKEEQAPKATVAIPQAKPAPTPSPQRGEGRGEGTTPAPISKGDGASERVVASPLARRLAGERGIELATLTGSGPHGRIIKSDVETFRPGARPAPARPDVRPAEAKPAPSPGLQLPDARSYFAPGTYDEIKHDGMRKAIARRLTAAVAAMPHIYLTIECEIDKLLQLRKDLNAHSTQGEGSYKLSVNDFVVRAVAMALMKSPDVNVSWTDDAMLRHHQADVGIAVALPHGLITPIVRHAELKGLAELSHEIADLATRARDKKLKPAEYEGGSFTVSNLGMFGVKEFTAIINPPQAAILAVGKGEERAVVKNGAIVKANMMSLTASFDHRAIDGATGAQFLQILKGFIEDPTTMLL